MPPWWGCWERRSTTHLYQCGKGAGRYCNRHCRTDAADNLAAVAADHRRLVCHGQCGSAAVGRRNRRKAADGFGMSAVWEPLRLRINLLR